MSKLAPDFCCQKQISIMSEVERTGMDEICWKTNVWQTSTCRPSAGSNGSQQHQQQNQQPDLRIRRQHSSDSVSSITSATSHSSVGSNMDADAKNKKKNKKNWVRIRFDTWRVTNKQAARSHGGLFLSLSLCTFSRVCWCHIFGFLPFRHLSLGRRWIHFRCS